MTGKGSDSIGKDRKRVPAGDPLTSRPPSRNWCPRQFAKAPDGPGSARGTLDRILRVQVVPANPLVVRVVVSVPT